MEKRFSINFTKKALKEYNSLDGAIVGEVDEALESLEERADEVGKPLGNKRQINLTGTKEKKLRSSGIRIIYQITDRRIEVLQIVEILLIDFKRDETELYQEAEHRYLEALKRGGTEDGNALLLWRQKDSVTEEIEPINIIDLIFDGWFDSLSENIKDEILDHYAHGRVELAYLVWLAHRGDR
jgi:mRNA interferase RelE/StbE